MIESFLIPLHDLLLGDGACNIAKAPLFTLVFMFGCAIMALLVLLLDICVFLMRGWSFLRYPRSFVRSAVAIVFMPLAAGIVGYVGLATDILQPSRSACIAVGIAWPSLMTVLFGVTEKPQTDPEEDRNPEIDEESET